MTTSNQQLIALMSKHRLSSSEVAKLTHVSIDTVHAWRSSPNTSRHRVMPKGLLELLEIKVDKES
jgi:hypothetical protein